MTTVYDFSARSISGEEVSLDQYRGKVLLIVNTASKCGFTPQYDGLEKLHEELSDRGLVVLGFPCNQFGAQEPGDEAEIASFCRLSYDVKFPMFAKIDVNGDATHPLYKWLKTEAKGLLGSEGIKWNFTKFLIDRAGNVVDRYAPTTKPEAIRKDIEKLL
ncbi:glutathione peroxidase [Sphingomonas crocodyli]|uniref:Glutathione peroxidase n=1 Tax=Sphingomonas crocodyli TaxID=1979270 RepID=A0A437LVS3_9SPHN|nr:glutathione peroxidase [Sphingomonas crocodyli]RVT89486.1 glutathione peroxidase [Sphingomonas crocodyli]